MINYQYHPDDLIYVRTEAGVYVDTPANLALDASVSEDFLPKPGTGERELRYIQGEGTAYHNKKGITRYVAGPLPNADQIVNDPISLFAAKASRTAPPPPPTPQEILVANREHALNDLSLKNHPMGLLIRAVVKVVRNAIVQDRQYMEELRQGMIILSQDPGPAPAPPTYEQVRTAILNQLESGGGDA